MVVEVPIEDSLTGSIKCPLESNPKWRGLSADNLWGKKKHAEVGTEMRQALKLEYLARENMQLTHSHTQGRYHIIMIMAAAAETAVAGQARAVAHAGRCDGGANALLSSPAELA